MAVSLTRLDGARRRVEQDVSGASARGPWAGVVDEQWCDWRWQQRHRITTLDALEEVIEVTEAERVGWTASQGRFRMAITPYYAALMDPRDPCCPVRRQAVPHEDELSPDPFALEDPLGEERYMPVVGLTHRYPDRVLLYVTHNCPVYCRHCTRKRKVSDPGSAASRRQLEDGIQYIREHTEVRDVLVSGGDPLSLSDDRLVEIMDLLASIPHVELIRLCTRNPVTLPFRFTDELLERLRPYHPILVHTHFNHPAECTPEAARCLRRLADAGFSTANQMVLLRGVNDDAEPVREVNHWLLRQRCRPYYLFQADLAEGVAHFRTPVQTGVDIIEALRGHTSGMAVPHYVIDAPGGGGKVALVPDSVKGTAGDELVLENYQGELYHYPK